MNEARTNEPGILIAGAGPTGLVLALWLTRIGVPVRIVDRAARPGTTSRAVVVHARTLEFYRQLGIADRVVAAGLPFPRLNLWVRGRRRAGVDLGAAGEGRSPFPFVLIYPQDEHETLLIEELRREGVEVERETELTGFRDRGTDVMAKLRHADGRTEEARFRYLAGCDGAHSTVRHQLDLGFHGSTYPGHFYVADIRGEGPALDGGLHVSLDHSDFMAVFPMKGAGHARLIGDVLGGPSDREPGWRDVAERPAREMNLRIDEVAWFSTYRVHHRVAARFRKGRVFLLGDAGHIHSPVGGQGMNTGIGDAVNLAWKLGAVLRQGADPRLLETYEPERIVFARRLVATVDRAFVFVSSRGRLARFVRTFVVPRVMRLAFRAPAVRRALFGFVSQTAIAYRDGALSEPGPASGVQAGDRLPWIAAVDNYAPLASLDWQVHLYGAANGVAFEAAVPVHRFPWHDEMEAKDLVRGRAYLIRPDGHVALVCSAERPQEVARYFRKWSPAGGA